VTPNLPVPKLWFYRLSGLKEPTRSLSHPTSDRVGVVVAHLTSSQFEIKEIQPTEWTGLPPADFPAQDFLSELLVYLSHEKIRAGRSAN
jgi:hypothetical protein